MLATLKKTADRFFRDMAFKRAGPMPAYLTGEWYWNGLTHDYYLPVMEKLDYKGKPTYMPKILIIQDVGTPEKTAKDDIASTFTDIGIHSLEKKNNEAAMWHARWIGRPYDFGRIWDVPKAIEQLEDLNGMMSQIGFLQRRSMFDGVALSAHDQDVLSTIKESGSVHIGTRSHLMTKARTALQNGILDHNASPYEAGHFYSSSSPSTNAPSKA